MEIFFAHENGETGFQKKTPKKKATKYIYWGYHFLTYMIHPKQSS